VGNGAVCAELTRLEERGVGVARPHEGDVVPSSLDLLVSRARPRSVPSVQRSGFGGASSVETGFGSPVAIAVHDGRCIALTRAGKPESFGETLHRGQSLLLDCPPGVIALSASITSDRAVAWAVHESELFVAVDAMQEGPYAGAASRFCFPDFVENLICVARVPASGMRVRVGVCARERCCSR